MSEPAEQRATLERLTTELEARRYERPFILFLGSDVARAAGVRMEEIAPALLADLYESTTRQTSYASSYLPDSIQSQLANLSDATTHEEKIRLAYELLASVPEFSRNSLLQRYLQRIPVPRFYQDLARHIQAGYFQHILTTNIDTLLEQALDSIGMRRGLNYRVIYPSTRRRSSSNTPDDADNPTAIRIIKLHGDIAQENFAITPDEIDTLLNPQRYAVKAELTGDIVMVGYHFESEPINKWLTWTPGVLWWISEDPPDPERMALIERAREVNYLIGASAAPERCFGMMTMLLSRLGQGAPSFTKGIDEDLEFSLESLESADLDIADVQGDTASAADEDTALEVEYLREQIRRGQTELARLEQQRLAGNVRPDQILVQLDYESQRIAQFEDKLRILLYSPPEIVDRIRRVASAHREIKATAIAEYVEQQAQAVEQAFVQDPPNHALVSAALGAVALLVARMEQNATRSELVNSLVTVAPSAVAKGGIWPL